jgi:hypothetical protein
MITVAALLASTAQLLLLPLCCAVLPQVRVLLSSGGEYEEVTASEGSSGGRSTRWRCVGGFRVALRLLG